MKKFHQNCLDRQIIEKETELSVSEWSLTLINSVEWVRNKVMNFDLYEMH